MLHSSYFRFIELHKLYHKINLACFLLLFVTPRTCKLSCGLVCISSSQGDLIEHRAGPDLVYSG